MKYYTNLVVEDERSKKEFKIYVLNLEWTIAKRIFHFVFFATKLCCQFLNFMFQ